ncbi:hypothetical protein JL722_3628 [Aureococcus anophagefferens]|nr:hypothetical protein JL722_3628 [Aureococcus anophagefferens]
MEPSITAAKWQDRREAWEQLSTFDAEPNAAALAKENNGAVVDAALDALARWATSGAPVADAVAGDPSVVAAIITKGLASSRAATGRRGLAALEAFYGARGLRARARGPLRDARGVAARADATVVALSEAASPEARSAAAEVVLAVERADAARGEALVERLKGPARKAVDKLRASGGAPDAAPEPKRVNDENAPPPAAKVVDAPPPPPGDGGDFAEVLETLGLAEPFDDAFAKLENWLARKDALDAIAGSFVAGDAGRDENLVAAVARVCANDAHAKVVRDYAALAAADCGDRDAALRGAAVELLGALAARPKADVDKALKGLDKRARKGRRLARRAGRRGPAVARELRRGDAQPKLRPLACVAAAAWVSRVGPSRDVAARVAAKAGLTKAMVFAALDSARGVKEAALEALGACAGEAPGRPAVARAVAEHVAPHLGAALAGAASRRGRTSPTGSRRAPLLDASHGGDVAQHLAGPLVALLRDKSKRHRDAARDALRALAAPARSRGRTWTRACGICRWRSASSSTRRWTSRSAARTPRGGRRRAKPDADARSPGRRRRARGRRGAAGGALPAAFDFSATAFEAYAPRPPKPPAAPLTAGSAAAGAWAGLDGLEVAGAVFRCAPAARARDADLALRASSPSSARRPPTPSGATSYGGARRRGAGAARLEDSLPHVVEPDAPRKLRHQLDALAAAAALHARRADAVAAILDAFRDDALDRLGAGHLAKLLTVALRDDDAFVAALRRGEAEPCLCAASAVLDAVPADAPKLSLDAAKTVVAAAGSGRRRRALAPATTGPSSPSSASSAAATAARRRRRPCRRTAAATSPRSGSAARPPRARRAPAAGGAEKHRIAALRQRLDAHRVSS